VNFDADFDVDQSEGSATDLFFAIMALARSEWRPVWQEAPPYWADLELAVIEDEGPHALVFPCRRITGGFMKLETKAPIDVRPTHWRYWQS